MINAPSASIAANKTSAQLDNAGTSVAGAETDGPPVELLPPFGSDVPLETPAPLLIVPVVPGTTLVTIVKIPVPPLPIEEAVHVIVPVVPTGGVVQVQPGGATIDWKRSDDGRVSVKTGFTAPFGPPLVTVKTYVIVVPLVDTVPLTPRSAEPAVKEAVAELLPETGSLGVPETEAELPMEPLAFDTEVTTRVNVADAPFVSDAEVQLIVPVVPTVGVVQLKPPGEVIDWKSNDAGRTSVIVTEVAASGP